MLCQFLHSLSQYNFSSTNNEQVFIFYCIENSFTESAMVKYEHSAQIKFFFLFRNISIHLCYSTSIRKQILIHMTASTKQQWNIKYLNTWLQVDLVQMQTWNWHKLQQILKVKVHKLPNFPLSTSITFRVSSPSLHRKWML